MSTTLCSLSRSPLAVAITMILACGLMSSTAHAATQEELEAQVKNMEQQIQEMKTQLEQLKQQQAAQTPSQSNTAVSQPAPATVQSGPTFFGYGELNYSHPKDNSANTTADLARFVIGVGYEFDDKTHLNSELELEHAVSSASDPGEIEVEQAYIDHDLGHGMYAKAGLFLIPSGLLNENHEPTRYYGVFRNFVETSIIPTTWREGGVAIQSNSTNGLRVDAGLTTGFDLSKWDFGSADGQGEGHDSPLGSIHQELALAHAKDLSGFVALNYTGINDLKLGGSLFTGGASQGQLNTSSEITLWETHARWTPGNADISALYAHGHISSTTPVNTPMIGSVTLIPENFFGWYVQGAYRLWHKDSYMFAPFIRYERFNTASRYASLPINLTPAILPDQQAWTAGFNFNIADGVVLKADYVMLKHSDISDRFDLGLGYQF